MEQGLMEVTLPAGLTLRRAGNEDSGAVKALVWQVLREYGMEPDPAHADRGLDHIETAFDGGGLWLVFDKNALVGTAGLVRKSDSVCEVTKMFLLPTARGKGLGRALLNGLVTEARARGYREIHLETDTSLVEAVGLYSSFGFERLSDENSVARCNLVMRLKLW